MEGGERWKKKETHRDKYRYYIILNIINNIGRGSKTFTKGKNKFDLEAMNVFVFH